MGDYIRKEKGGHSTGERVDIGGFDWTGSKGPDQIVTALKALPPDKYGIGLPFQGEFFPRDQWFNPQAKQAVADAEKANKTTADITTPLLTKGSTLKVTGTWDTRRRRDDPAELGRAARLEAQVGRRQRGRSAQERDAQEGRSRTSTRPATTSTSSPTTRTTCTSSRATANADACAAACGSRPCREVSRTRARSP